uniref:Amino acid permease/ SLC12A domain-containing protein n=1 Tax=Bionectria ochroleuca TaxID=29856 RepID=A0A8H7TMS9_BIOOC
MFFLAFTVLGTWSTFAQGLNSGLTSGGPVTILWGLILVTFCNICVAVSLGELCSSMPTALGQAYYVSRLWPGGWGRFMSYMCAWINTFGWWTLSASQLTFMTNFILSMKVLYTPDWPEASVGWINFLLYLGLTILVTLVNVVACRRDAVLPFINNFVRSMVCRPLLCLLPGPPHLGRRQGRSRISTCFVCIWYLA